MTLAEDQQVVDYLAERRRLRESQGSSLHPDPVFTFGRPHSCKFCSVILIDGEICNKEWTRYKEQTEPVMNTALSQTHIPASSTRLNTTLPQLIEGAQKGCTWYEYLCDFLITSSREEDQPFTGANAYDIIFCLAPKSNALSRVEWFNLYGYVLEENGDVARSFFTVNLKVWADEGNPASAYVNDRPFEVNKASNKSSVFAMKRLETCLREHPRCRQRIQPDDQALSKEVLDSSDLPTRLLRITKEQDGLHVRLVEVKNLSGETRKEICEGGYVSLSYCWGGDQPVKLTTSSAEQLKSGMDAQHLPRTLTDAIQVTNSLGIKNIWIDALCIFQDNAMDKEMEIARLPLYYSRNTLTLSAASASRCTIGILNEILQAVIRGHGPFELSFSTKAGQGTVQLFVSRSSPDEPIVQRAWTLQESALSRRVLAFASDEIQWYCLTGHAVCSSGHDVLEPPFGSFMEGNETSLGPVNRNILTLASWRLVVSQFMSRRLTVESDKLLAISALASRTYETALSKMSGLTYVAGLFVVPSDEWSWIEPLLWIPNCLTARRSLTYRAPSWSWACLDTNEAISDLGFLRPLKSSGYKYTQAFTILDHNVELSVPSAPFGSVKAASIHVDGAMRQFSGKQTFEVTLTDSSGPLMRLMSQRPSRNELFLIPDTGEDKSRMQTAIAGGTNMLLLCLLPPWITANRSWPAAGLALREDPGSGVDRFRRVGVFAFYGTCDNDGLAALNDFFDIEGDIHLI